jgi:Transposase, Mutator family
MSTRTHSRVELDELGGGAGVERSEPGGRAQGDAGGAVPDAGLPVEPLAAAGGRSGGLPAELVEAALARARLRERGLPVEGLAPEARERLSGELIDELLGGARTEEEIVGPGGLLAELTRRLVERALEVELTEHLGYEPHAEPPGGAGNARNGSTPKTLQTEHGPVRIEAPRDRRGRSSRGWCASASGASRASTTRSSPCTRAA